MTIVVTGVPGWLGSTLLRRLQTEEDERARIFVLNDLSSFTLPDDVEVVRGDIRTLDADTPLLEGDISSVFHCAGINHPPPLSGPSTIHEVNAGGTTNVLEAVRKQGADHVTFVSSVMVHDHSDPESEVTESDPPDPDTEYGRSKLRAEQSVREYSEQYGIDYTIVRPCWYYGPRQPDRIATLMQSIQNRYPIMFGDGTNRRSMTYLPTLVDALLTIRHERSKTAGETYLVADANPYETNHIYRTIANCLDIDFIRPIRLRQPLPTVMKYVQRTLEAVDVHSKYAHVGWEMSRDIVCDPQKAATELGLDLNQELESGMQEAVDWARENGQL